MPSRKGNAKDPEKPKAQPLTEEDLDALDCLEIDRRLRIEKRIPLAEVLKEYGRQLSRRRPVAR